MSLPEFGPALAYGPFPGIELIPYFLGLLAWVGLAVFAVMMSFLKSLWGRLRRKQSQAAVSVAEATTVMPPAESQGAGRSE